MPLNIDQTLALHAQALRLRGERAEVLAANLANADTPNFKARDVDFRAVLEQADGPALRAGTTHARHINPAAPETALANPQYRIPLQASLDGNTVDAQLEKAAFAENAVEYQTSLQFLNSKLRGLMGALKGE